MRLILVALLLFTFVKSDDRYDEHNFFITVYLDSTHFTKNDDTDKHFNEVHRAYGLEYINTWGYTLTYNHFINSRGMDVDVYGAGYLLDFNSDFGLHLIGGYQEGYCFDGFLNSVECTQSKDNSSEFFLPMLYYKHEYFKIDFFTSSDMIAFRFNIKVY